MNSKNNLAMEKPLSGFEKIHRYWDQKSQRCIAKVKPGEFYVTRYKEDIATVLGSCISACIRDPKAKIGGMNHFMLPSSHLEHVARNTEDFMLAARYGNYAMEALINEILKNNGSRNRLEIKLFGGGRILTCMTDIGSQNIEFVHKYLQIENLKLTGEDVGGNNPRKIMYDPISGEVKVKRLKAVTSQLVEEENKYKRSIETKVPSGKIDLF